MLKSIKNVIKTAIKRIKFLRILAFIYILNSRMNGTRFPEDLKGIQEKFTTLRSLRILLLPNKEKTKWRAEAKRIRKKYKIIHIYGLHWGRVGESVSSYLLHLSLFNEPGQYKLLASHLYHNENKVVLRIFDRYIPVIMLENYARWLYVCCKNIDMIDIFNLINVVDRHEVCDRIIDSKWASEYFYLTEQETKEAESKITYMDVRKPYVCILNRDTAYLKDDETGLSHHKYRNFEINCFEKMAREFKKLGIPLVRMGQRHRQRAEFENCIEHCFDHYDELTDVYLCGHCKFWIGAESGANLMVRAQDVPIVIVNQIDVAQEGWSFMPQVKDRTIFIIKKFYSKKLKRSLSLWEIFWVNIKTKYDSRIYDKMDIELIDNTPEEVCDVAMEMNARLDGTWVETEEDKKLQVRFWEIKDKWDDFIGTNKNSVLYGRIGAKFLRENKYLLEYDKIVRDLF